MPKRKAATKKAAKPDEDAFQEIADDAITLAEAVDCSLSEFAAGLKTIKIAITERLELAVAELGRIGLDDD